jgi:hypothetical protein
MSRFGYAGSGQALEALDWAEVGKIVSDPWFAGRLATYLASGVPKQGYRTDPVSTELRAIEARV